MEHALSAKPLALSRQLLVVLAEDWTSSTGQLQRYARPDVTSHWQAVGAAIPVSLGRQGLAWGLGYHAVSAGAVMKREGDGRAPAGAFAITALFGEAPPDEAVTCRFSLPYLQATADMKAVDDPASRHYNRLLDGRRVAVDWSSAEDLRRSDERYRLGAVVGHNTDPVVPGAGSCIFLHVWAGPGQPTAGCTAMPLDELTILCGWLAADARPLLVQLPRAEYEARRQAWSLP